MYIEKFDCKSVCILCKLMCKYHTAYYILYCRQPNRKVTKLSRHLHSSTPRSLKRGHDTFLTGGASPAALMQVSSGLNSSLCFRDEGLGRGSFLKFLFPLGLVRITWPCLQALLWWRWLALWSVLLLCNTAVLFVFHGTIEFHETAEHCCHIISL